MAKKKKQRRKATAPALPPPPSASNRLGVVVAVVLLAGLAIAVAILGKRPPSQAAAPPPEPTPIQKWEAAELKDILVSADNFAVGPEDAPITIVEYSDFECPFCRDASQTLAFVRELYGDKLRHVYKDFPLDTACHDGLPRQVHALGCVTAAMARCAGAQGRFWEMHDALFAFSELSVESLAGLSETLGLESDTFSDCVQSADTRARIRSDISEGKRLGVTATPTIFVNGREVASYWDLQETVEHILSTVR